MKKIYEVKVATCDCEGRYNGNETEYVATENIEAVVEANIKALALGRDAQ